MGELSQPLTIVITAVAYLLLVYMLLGFLQRLGGSRRS